MPLKVPAVAVLLFLCVVQDSMAQLSKISEVPITYPNGSGGVVNCVFQDSYGFIWIGKESGLYRYDGNTLKTFKQRGSDSTSLSANHILCLAEDNQHNIYIGTKGGGLNRYDPKTGKFKRYIHHNNNKQSISFDEVSALFKDDKGYIWVGTDGGGLNLFDSKSEKFISYPYNRQKKSGIKNTKILSISGDKKGNLWLGTWDTGLILFNPKNNKSTSIGEGSMYSRMSVYASKEVRPGIIWAATFLNQVFEYNTQTKTFKTILPGSASNSYTDIALTKEGEIYVAAWNGLYFFPRYGTAFRKTQYISSGFINVKKLLIDNTQTLWMTTTKDHLLKINSFQKKFNSLDTALSFSSSKVFSIHADAAPNNIYLLTKTALIAFNSNTKEYRTYPVSTPFWAPMVALQNRNSLMLTTRQGLKEFDLLHKTQTPLRFGLNTPDFISELSVRALSTPNREDVWIAGYNSIFKISASKESITWRIVKTITEGAEGFPKAHYSTCFLPLTNGTLWVGTFGGGLAVKEAGSNRFRTFINRPGSVKSIPNNFIECLASDNKGNIWIGTQSGLTKFNPKTGVFTSLKRANGLPDEWISNIAFDAHNRAWITTNSGISSISNNLKNIRNYDLDDGLISNQFMPRSNATAQNGTIYFGSKKGLIWFHPDSIRDNPHVAPPLLTGFKINSQEVAVTHNGPLTESLETASNIALKSNQKELAFKLIVPGYFNNARNKLIYRLIGHDPGWKVAQNNQIINYSNLSPGKYTLLVKSANEDGIQSPRIREIKLTVAPPFWLSGWALLLYLTIVCSAYYLFTLQRPIIVLGHTIKKPFQKSDLIQPAPIETTSANLAYVQRAITIVEENISDYDFNVQQLCDKMNQSQRQLNRKIKEIADVTIVEFIREVRLKRAAQLLENKSATVSEVAYRVGFNNPKHFSTCFKKKFGISPTLYHTKPANGKDI